MVSRTVVRKRPPPACTHAKGHVVRRLADHRPCPGAAATTAGWVWKAPRAAECRCVWRRRGLDVPGLRWCVITLCSLGQLFHRYSETIARASPAR